MGVLVLLGWALWSHAESHAGDREVRYNPLQRLIKSSRESASGSIPLC